MSGEAPSVLSRKFKPVYEALDAHNFRDAIKLCERRDIEATPLAKALKALCLARLGAEGEALELCDAVMRGVPSEEDVCTPLASALFLCGAGRRAAKMFEAAVGRNPSSVPLQREYHFASLLLGEHKAQQLTAMKLWKESGDSEYVCWAAMAIHGQSPGEGPADALKLAEMLLKKPLDTGALRHSEALGLLFKTMLRQGKAPEALAAFRGPYHFVTSAEEEAKIAGDDAALEATPDKAKERNEKKGAALFQPGDAIRMEIFLCIQCEVWAEARDAYVRALTTIDAEDWSFHVGLVSTLFLAGAVVDTSGVVSPAVPPVIESVADLRALLRQLQTVGLEKRSPASLRGPFLAEILLDLALLQKSTSVASPDGGAPVCTGPLADGVTQRIIRYISAVGVSSCAFLDLQRLLSPYIHPSSRSPAGMCAGGASPPISVDPSTLALLSSFGLVYPAVDTAIRPLPALALIPTFNIAMGETQREALYAHVRSLTGEGQRPPADVTATVGPLPAVEEELTPEQSAALTRVRDSFQLNITALQIRRYLGLGKSGTSSVPPLVLAASLAEDWKRSAAFRPGCERNIGVLPGDDYILLAVHILRDEIVSGLNASAPACAASLPTWQLILEALTLLEAGLKDSVHNSQFRLLQLELYGWVGAALPLVDTFNGLRPKHMQLDTLASKILPALESSGGPFIGRDFSDNLFKFHRTAIADITDMTRQAFIKSSYSKVFEFEAYKAKLRKSLQLVAAKSHAAQYFLPFRQFSEMHGFLRKIILTGEIPVASIDLSEAEMDDLLDHTDFNAALSWDPPSDDGWKSASRSSAISKLKLRQQYLRLLYWVAEGNVPGLTDAVILLTKWLNALGWLPSEDGSMSAVSTPVGQGYATARPSIVADIWSTVVTAFDSAKTFYQASASPSAALWQQTAAGFCKVAAKIASLSTAITEAAFVGVPTATVLSSKGSLDVLISPAFFAEACVFVSELVSVAAAIGFACAKALPKRKAAKRSGGKGKGPAAAAAVDPEEAALDAIYSAVSELVASVSKGTKPVQVILGIHDRIKSSPPTPAFSTYGLSVYNPTAAVSDFAKSETGVTQAAKLYFTVQQSQVFSLKQLDDLLSDRTTMAKAARV